MIRLLYILLILVLFVNPVFAKDLLSEKFLTKKLVTIEEGETFTISPGSLIEILDSRFESGCAQLKIDGSLKIVGKKNKPAIVTFKEKAFNGLSSKVKTIEIDQETLLNLPEDTEIIQYKTKKYEPEELESEIYDHTFKGFPVYALMFVLAAYVTTFK